MTRPSPAGILPDFSLFLGGPLYQLLRRGRLTDDTLGLLHRRILFALALCWLPPLLLAAAEGRLQDPEFHLRFLVALPLLIMAELVVHERLRLALPSFLDRDIVPPDSIAAFKAAIEDALRWRNSITAEVLLLALVYLVGVLIIWRNFAALETSSWYASPTPQGMQFSLAGLWFGVVSLPVLQFLLCRWYWRLAIWAVLLWRLGRLPLILMPAHPDRAGGLGFLSDTIGAFAILGTAHGALMAGLLADRILYLHAALPDFLPQIAVVLGFVLMVAICPLLAFTPRLIAARRQGIRRYDALAERYVRAFDRKWLQEDAGTKEALLGTADLQSLADLGNSLEVVRNMRFVPVLRQDVLLLALATLLPCAPLMLTVMPLREMAKMLLGVLM